MYYYINMISTAFYSTFNTINKFIIEWFFSFCVLMSLSKFIAISSEIITQCSVNTIDKFIKEEQQNTSTNFVVTMLVIIWITNTIGLLSSGVLFLIKQINKFFNFNFNKFFTYRNYVRYRFHIHIKILMYLLLTLIAYETFEVLNVLLITDSNETDKIDQQVLLFTTFISFGLYMHIFDL
jgi:hypothetical protein